MTRIAIIAIALTVAFVISFALAVNPAYADAGFVSKVENTEKKPTRTAAKSISKKQLKAAIKQIQDLEYRARLGRIPCAKANKEINAIARNLPANVNLTLEAEKLQTGYSVDPHDTGCYIYLYPRH
jgi:hypothetical protein